MTGQSSINARKDVAVIGGGPAGLVAAIACAKHGFDTVLVAGSEAAEDGRTTALLAPSIALLKQLGLWSALADRAAPLQSMRIIDDTGRLVRAPETVFHASELELEAFGYNVTNVDITTGLKAAAQDQDTLQILNSNARKVRFQADRAAIEVERGPDIIADLVIGADGRQSMVRKAAGIKTRSWRYDQVAIVCNLDHQADHHWMSTEFHTPTGPFTLVPLPGDGRQSSLVCVVTAAEAESVLALPRPDLNRDLERRAHSVLGRMTIATDPQVFPLGCQLAVDFSGPHVALIGEAAHVFPPIGAQGLNLGFRDAAALVETLVYARRDDKPIGAASTLAHYNSSRNLDVWTRTAAVDMLNRTLLSDILPVQMARGLGLYLSNRVGVLRRLLMRQSLAPMISGPRLTRGLPLG